MKSMRPMLVTVCAILMLSALFGCGAAKDAINSNLPTIDNALQLDNQTVTGSVNGSRAAISGNGTRTFTFPNTSLTQASALTEIRHTQRLDPTVTVTVPSGASLPTTFSLRNVALSVVLSDIQVNADGSSDQRTFTANMTVNSAVTYVQTGANSYTANAAPTFNDLLITGDNLNQFRNIVTGGPSPNTATVKLSFDTDTLALPAGSEITFKFANGTARIKI